MSKSHKQSALEINPQMLAKLLLKISEKNGLGLCVFKIDSEGLRPNRLTKHVKRPTVGCFGSPQDDFKPPRQSLDRTAMAKYTQRKAFMENISEELRKAAQQPPAKFNIYTSSRHSLAEEDGQPVIAVKKASLELRRIHGKENLPPLESEFRRPARTPNRQRHCFVKAKVKGNAKPDESICIVDNWTAENSFLHNQSDTEICDYMNDRSKQNYPKDLPR